jgi:hypothetical protein
MSPARSTRQLSWVFGGLLLYAPATVKTAAYAHTTATEKRTAYRLYMLLHDFII